MRVGAVPAARCFSSLNAFQPTEEHEALRNMVRNFTETEVEPQAQEFNRTEKFNMPLFKRAGELGLYVNLYWIVPSLFVSVYL